MYISTNGIKLYCEVSELDTINDGRPVLLLVPGGPGINHAIYKTHSAALEKNAHIIYIDPRGCGKSEKGNVETYTMENAIEDIEGIRRHLGIKKIILLGTSYGSMVAMGYAIKYSDNLDKLILVTGAPSHNFLQDAKKNLLERGTKRQIDICTKLLWGGNFKTPEDIIEFFLIMTPLYSYTASQKNNDKGAFSDERITFSVEPLNYAFKTFFRTFNYIDQLHKITCDTLILAGKYDWINDPKHAMIMYSKISNAILKVYEFCGHSIAVDQHEKYISDITNFIKSKNILCDPVDQLLL